MSRFRHADQVIALVDCKAFYVSCERLFRPDLRRTPVGVLSNNDGCIIARSDELKALGVRMGAPYFKARSVLEANGAVVFSSNYALYADLSRRVTEALATFSSDVEVYSIDEAFLTLPRLPAAHQADLCEAIHDRVYQWTGIPVRVSTGATKTLAKVAQARCKQLGRWAYALDPERPMDEDLAALPVGDVWGVGSRYAAKLAAHGIDSALALRDAPDAWVRRQMTVTGLRTVHELRGVPCLPLDLAPPPKKSICRSRTFGEAVTDKQAVAEAVATFASAAAFQLRKHGLAARDVAVFVSTGRFAKGRRFSASRSARLMEATNFTPTLVGVASRLLDQIWQPGVALRKAGVLLLELVPTPVQQHALFSAQDDAARARDAALMGALDHLNSRYGLGAVYVARGGHTSAAKPWRSKATRRSPAYTTRLADLPIVR